MPTCSLIVALLLSSAALTIHAIDSGCTAAYPEICYVPGITGSTGSDSGTGSGTGGSTNSAVNAAIGYAQLQSLQDAGSLKRRTDEVFKLATAPDARLARRQSSSLAGPICCAAAPIECRYSTSAKIAACYDPATTEYALSDGTVIYVRNNTAYEPNGDYLDGNTNTYHFANGTVVSISSLIATSSSGSPTSSTTPTSTPKSAAAHVAALTARSAVLLVASTVFQLAWVSV